MASSPWPRDDVVHALRELLLAPGAVTAGFTGIDVLPALPGEPVDGPVTAGSLVVLFRWELDPAVYAVRFHLEAAVDGPTTGVPMGVSTGVPVDSLQGWTWEVALWLMEELDTGFVRRGARRQVGDVVLLVAGTEAVDVLPMGFYVGDVHLGSNGDHLQQEGLHVEVARRLLEQDRLLVWLHAHMDNARGEPFVGHVVVSSAMPSGASGVPDGPARLEVLEVVPGTPAAVVAALAFHAVRSAVETGVASIVSDVEDSALDQIGFRRGRAAARVVHWDDVRAPHL